MKALAQLTRSRVGFRGNQFRLEPTAPWTAKIKTALTDTAPILELKDFSRSNYPNRGAVFVSGELMTYTGLSMRKMTGLTRGAFETNADGHPPRRSIWCGFQKWMKTLQAFSI